MRRESQPDRSPSSESTKPNTRIGRRRQSELTCQLRLGERIRETTLVQPDDEFSRIKRRNNAWRLECHLGDPVLSAMERSIRVNSCGTLPHDMLHTQK